MSELYYFECQHFEKFETFRVVLLVASERRKKDLLSPTFFHLSEQKEKRDKKEKKDKSDELPLDSAHRPENSSSTPDKSKDRGLLPIMFFFFLTLRLQVGKPI